MTANSSIDVGQDVEGVGSPQGPIRPVAVQTISGVDYPVCILFDGNGNEIARYQEGGIKQGKMDYSAVPVAFGDLVSSSIGTILAVNVQNSLNQPVDLSFDGGTSVVELNDDQNFSVELGDKGLKLSNGIKCRYSSSPPTSGRIIAWVTILT